MFERTWGFKSPLAHPPFEITTHSSHCATDNVSYSFGTSSREDPAEVDKTFVYICATGGQFYVYAGACAVA